MEEIIKKASLAVLFLSLTVSIALGASQDVITLPEEAVSKKTLDNGLTVLTKYSPPQNLAVIDVKVGTGSSLEGEYLGSGISHLVEHMIFKGTKARGVGAIEKEVKSYGGIINGSVSHDITDFYIILPSKYLPQALAILKDMLLNAKMDPVELAKEKEVVLKEIRMNEDDPEGRLMRLLNEKAYLNHSYRFPTIGYKESLEALTGGDLVKYYKTRYVPNRIIVTVVGGIDEADAISQVEKEFKDFRRADYSVSDLTRPEPQQIQPRSVDEYMDTNLAYLAMGFHSTSILNEDLFSMDVLSMILGRGDNSRLNKVLYKDRALVHTIGSWNYTPRDPGLFVLTAVLDKDKLGETEKAAMEEIDLARNSLVRDNELEAAKRMVLADFISTLETVDGQANDISTSYALTGSEKFSRRYIDGIRAVTKEGVKAAANKYLRADNLTTVRLMPRNVKGSNSKEERPSLQNPVKQAVLSNGLKVFVRENKKTPTVTITAAMIGGLAAETKENNGISNITADMILRSTKARPDSGQIKGKIQDLGGDIDTFSGANTFGVNISVLKPDVDLALEILKDILVNANFPEREFEKSKNLMIASITSEDDDIFKVGMNTLKKELFGLSPYGLRTTGERKSVRSLKRDDAARFYEKYYAPNNMVIALSGDVDSEKLMGKIKERFSDLKVKKISTALIDKTTPDKTKAFSIAMDKEQSLIVLGFKTVPRKDPDRYALEVLGAVLSGYSGRLFNELRNTLSLAYTLGCLQDFWTDEGIFAFYVATTKERLPEAKEALMEEISKVRSSGITDDELAQAKRELSSRHQMEMQSNGFFTFNFAVEELRGLGYDNLYKYEAEIDKVTKEDVKRVSDKYFDLGKSVEVIVSPK